MDTFPEFLPDEAPEPGAALVVARWNSWVRLFFPDTGETSWMNMRDVGYRKVDPSSQRR